jgi:hypothetical protein
MELVGAASEHVQTHVDTLRGREVKWTAICKALGASRQAPWERFS